MSKINAILAEALLSYFSESTLFVGLIDQNKQELSGTGYSRQPVLLDGEGGSVSNTNDITFSTAGEYWGNATYAALYDSVEGGNLLMYEALTPQREIVEGVTESIPAGYLQIRLNGVGV